MQGVISLSWRGTGAVCCRWDLPLPTKPHNYGWIADSHLYVTSSPIAQANPTHISCHTVLCPTCCGGSFHPAILHGNWGREKWLIREKKKNKNKKKAKNYAGWWLWIEIERASEKGVKQSTPGNTSSTEMCPEMLCSDVWVEADPQPLQKQVLLLTEQLLNRLWVNRTTQPPWFSIRLLLLNYH